MFVYHLAVFFQFNILHFLNDRHFLPVLTCLFLLFLYFSGLAWVQLCLLSCRFNGGANVSTDDVEKVCLCDKNFAEHFNLLI